MMSSGEAFAVSDLSHVATARRAAQRLAEELSFSETRAGTVALVVTELASNLAKHARDGRLLFRAIEDPVGIEILSLDRGPGIPDIALSRRDGYSTAGTPGQGLGAVGRQANAFHIYSTPAGSAILAAVEREAPRPQVRLPRLQIGAVRVNAPGEQVCGDEWSANIRDERLAVLVADGLGHGLSAHEAAKRACRTFEQVHERTPPEILEAIHLALRDTRGAAVAVFVGDLERGTAAFCGLGNIAAMIVSPSGARQTLVSHNGTAGHAKPRIHEFQYPFAPGSMLVMQSDGVSPQWDLSAYPGLRAEHPSILAGTLFRDHGRLRDDATVVVVKERPPA